MTLCQVLVCVCERGASCPQLQPEEFARNAKHEHLRKHTHTHTHRHTQTVEGFFVIGDWALGALDPTLEVPFKYLCE